MVEMSMMMRLAALTVSCLSALVANGRPAHSMTHPDYDVLHSMMELVVVVTMMRLAALTVSCVSALVAHGRPAQAPCGAIDPNGRPTVAHGRPADAVWGHRPQRPTHGRHRPTHRRRAGSSTPTADPRSPTADPQTPCGTIDPNGRATVANGRPAQTPCGAHSAHEKIVQASL